MWFKSTCGGKAALHSSSQLAQVPMPVCLLAEGGLRQPVCWRAACRDAPADKLLPPPLAERLGASSYPATVGHERPCNSGDEQPWLRDCWVSCLQRRKAAQPHSSFPVGRKVLMGSLHLTPPTRFASFSLTRCVWIRWVKLCPLLH